MKLGDLSAGRDNNFNLMRMLAAYAVLISHSYALTAGTGAAEPGSASIGLSLGTVAVHVFFLASGFLVAASLLNRRSVIEFAWARALRIVPGLVVMLVLTALVLGPIYTTLPLDAYLRDGRTWEYMIRNAIPVARMAYELPGVFQDNPYKGAVNGSLWTLPYEVRMYLALALLWVVAAWVRRARAGAFEGLVVLVAVLSGCNVLATHFAGARVSEWSALGFMFFAGATFYVFRQRVTLTWPRFLAVLACWALTLFLHPPLFFPVYVVSVGYALFFLAYVPGGIVRGYNRFGDCSYGVYIYAFPAQQAVVASIPGASVTTVILMSTLVTLALAMLSWHFVERRALNLKGSAVDFTRRLFARSGLASPVTAKQNLEDPQGPAS